MPADKQQALLQSIIEEVRRHEHSTEKMQQAINYVNQLGFTPRVLELAREVEVAHPDCDWDYVQTIDEAIELIEG